MGGGWARGASQKFGTPYIFLQPLKLATSNLVQNFGLGLPYQKTFKTKLGGGLGQGNIPQKFGTPYSFLQPLKLATSNLLCNLGFGLAYQKNNVKDQNWRGHGPGEHPEKFGTSYLFPQPIKKIGTQQVYFAKHKF